VNREKAKINPQSKKNIKAIRHKDHSQFTVVHSQFTAVHSQFTASSQPEPTVKVKVRTKDT
jgi:hypothetical protein